MAVANSRASERSPMSLIELKVQSKDLMLDCLKSEILFDQTGNLLSILFIEFVYSCHFPRFFRCSN